MSAKNLDSKGRFRAKTIGFRVSPEEDQLINSAVALFGNDKTRLYRETTSLP